LHPTRQPTPVFCPIFTEIANDSSQMTVVRVETFESPGKDWQLEITTNEPKLFGELCHFEIKLTSSNNTIEWKQDESVLTDFTDDWLRTSAWLEPQTIQLIGEEQTSWQLNVASGEITKD
jgi:hypothetical protein